MKNSVFLLLVLLANLASAQTASDEKKSDHHIYNVVGIDQKPEFPGGMTMFYQYIASSLKVVDDNVGGRIIVSFIVEKDGSLDNIKVIRDIGAGSAAETIRVLNESPKWVPGKQNGEKVRCAFTLPIVIQPNVPAVAPKIETSEKK